MDEKNAEHELENNKLRECLVKLQREYEELQEEQALQLDDMMKNSREEHVGEITRMSEEARTMREEHQKTLADHQMRHTEEVCDPTTGFDVLLITFSP